MTDILYLRISPQVAVPWHPDYIVQRSLALGGVTGITLYRPEEGQHEITEPEASVFWDWFLGDITLHPNAAGVLDLTRPQGALQEARAALSLEPPTATWMQQVAPEQYKDEGFPPLAAPPDDGVPRIDLGRARKKMGL